MANTIKEKIKETFYDTPVAIRWMLLGAAFIVVLILISLVINKPKHQNKIVSADKNVNLIINPDSAEMLAIPVGGKESRVFNIKSTDAVVIDSVKIQDSVDGFSILNACQGDAGSINQNIGCKITAVFAPANANISGQVKLIITWHDSEDLGDLNKRTDTINVNVGVKADPEPINIQPSKPAVLPEPEPEPELEPEPEPEFEPEPEPAPVGTKPVLEKPAPVEKSASARKRVERCSDFAMPGYSNAGAQIGWIKPNAGRYEFHPFSDKECNNPTGIYNPNTGIITSIDSGKKIGTDADHVAKNVDLTVVPALTSKPKTTGTSASTGTPRTVGKSQNLKNEFATQEGGMHLIKKTINEDTLKGSADTTEAVINSRPYDRTFILRQFKPIPATIVSEVRADPSVYGCNNKDANGSCDGGSGIPVRATVDRNVYSDNGRTIIIPTGTLLMGYLTGDLPGPYKTIGRMQIKWYQFIRPDGVEFNFKDDAQDPYSADSQGRVGVPGYGSTDYIEQMVMPLLTAMVPAAVNMIAPIADTFVNQIDLDNNTVVQSGKVRSSELAKNEVITAWNQVAQKLIVDALDNTVPPFSIAAGTRITVYSPVDLIATCDKEENAGKKCAFETYSADHRRPWKNLKDQVKVDWNDSSWTGQVRSFNLDQFCTGDASSGKRTADNTKAADISAAGYDYRTVLAYCQSQNYQAKNQAKYEAYYQNKQDTGIQGKDADGNAITLTQGTKEYNQQVLGLKYEQDADGNDTNIIKNPFEKSSSVPATESVGSLDCDGAAPDANGCCPGETYTDMGDQGFNCCPAGGGDCFPPLNVN